MNSATEEINKLEKELDVSSFLIHCDLFPCCCYKSCAYESLKLLLLSLKKNFIVSF